MTLTPAAVDRMVEEWDQHFSTCRVCLVRGERLCFEGEYLTERVVVSRAALRAAADRPDNPISLLLHHGQTLPGVPA